MLLAVASTGCGEDSPLSVSANPTAFASSLDGRPGAIADSAARNRAHRQRLAAHARATMGLTTDVPTAPLSSPGTQAVVTIPISNSWAVAVNVAGVAVVTHLFLNQVTLLQVPSGQVLGTASVGLLPTSVAMSRDGARAYIADQFSHDVRVLDIATRSVVATFPTGLQSPISIAVSSNGTRLFVGDGGGTVASYDATTFAQTATFQAGGYVNALAVDSAGVRLFASNHFGGKTFELNQTSLTPMRSWSVGGIAQQVVFAQPQRKLLVANEIGYITEIDLVSGGMRSTALSAGAFGLVLPPKLDRATFTLPGAGAVQNYNVPLLTTGPVIPFPVEPRRIVFHAASKTYIVTDALGGVKLVR